MRRSVPWRTLISVGVAFPLALYAQALPPPAHVAAGAPSPLSSRVAPGGLSAAEVVRLAQNATQRVVVILRDQHANLPARGATRVNRQAAVAADQGPILAELSQVHAPNVRAFSLINAVAATVSSAEANHLRADAQVLAVVPDRVVKAPAQPRETAQRAAAPAAAAPAAVGSCNKNNPALAPEALELTHDAGQNPAIPSAQQIVTGTGVTVAWIADGLDPNNPDFIRPDGSHVFTDYQDFSGDGPNAPTSGGEAFGDASSIAAQGNLTYDLRTFVNTAHPITGCPYIRIVGMAPGASLMGLKAFNAAGESFTTALVQAIQYAVDHGADVINESFGANPYPDNAIDPISMADAAAIDAGLTVVTSSGDAGTAGTLGSPGTDPGVIDAGASTQFRLYAQDGGAGFPLGSGGYLSDNISAFSSSGISQRGDKTVDVVAPGDLGWALCSTNVAIYGACFDNNGNPAPIEAFGGTSEAAPLTAGEAALVIEAYRNTHGGVSPAPALVKEIIKSTASNMGAPGYEQGSGLINALRAVQAAASLHDANGSPAAQGDALLVSPGTLAATDAPNTPESFAVQVTNTGAQAQSVHLGLQQQGSPTSSNSYVETLDPATDPTFVDGFGRNRAYVEQDFTVPAGAQRLDAAISWDVVGQPFTLVRVTLFDPQGRFAAFSNPQDQGPPFTESGYGHVDVRFPTAGTWRAIVWTAASAAGYSGPVHLDVSTSNNQWIGSASPAQTLQPGQTGTFTVATHTPVAPGDLSAKVVVDATDLSTNVRHSDGAIPVILRSLVALGPSGGSFSGTLTGGNGRAFSPGQTLTYQFDVPAGLKDLDLSLAITDSNYNLEGVLVAPDGLPLDEQSTITAIDPSTGLPTAYTNAMQFFRRDPAAGRWQFVLFINNSISGAQTALPFSAHIAFNGVQVSAPGLPNSPGITLTQGVPAVVHVSVTNTGIVTKDLFIDPRLTQMGLLALGGVSATIPLQPSSPTPAFFAPPESTDLTIAAESMTPTVPISLDITNNDGAPPYGMSFVSNPGSPDIEGLSFPDPLTGDYAAVASSVASEVVPGQWLAYPMEVGPYADTAPPSIVQVGAVALTQQFDPAASASSGDLYAVLTGQAPSASYTPLTLGPGSGGTIDVTITPSAAKGAVVSGVLYVDAANANSSSIGLITNNGDELIAIPYSYTVG